MIDCQQDRHPDDKGRGNHAEDDAVQHVLEISENRLECFGLDADFNVAMLKIAHEAPYLLR